MKLLGIGIDVNPYIPISQRETENPTVFWLKPKTVGLVQKSIKFEKLLELPEGGLALFDEKQLEFLAVCDKVENFEFSDDNKRLHDLGNIKKISDKALLGILMSELEPNIFQEVSAVVNEWSYLNPAQRKAIELMTYFALAKNDGMSVQDRLSYNCDTCQVMEKFKERTCFYLNKTNRIPLPVLDQQDNFSGEYEIYPTLSDHYLNAEEFLAQFYEISTKTQPGTPAYLALIRMQKFIGVEQEICVTGIIDLDYIQVLDWAIDCKNFNTLPYNGSYFDQPNQLIEAFKIVHSTISEYERIKIENIQKKTKK